MELPPLIQRVVADVSGYTGPLRTAADSLRAFGGAGTQGLRVLQGKFDDVAGKIASVQNRLFRIDPAVRTQMTAVTDQMEKLKKVLDSPTMTKQLFDRLEGLGRRVTRADVSGAAGDVLGSQSWLSNLFGKDGMLGRLTQRLASGFFAWRGLQEMVQGFKTAAEHYYTAGIEAHKVLAESGIKGFQAAATGLISGVGKAVSGFTTGLSASLEGLLAGGPVQAQVAALGHTVQGIIGGVQDLFHGVVSAASGLAGGAVQAAVRRAVGNIQGGAGLGQAGGGALSLAGSGLLASGVGAPVGLGLIAGGMALSAGSSFVGGYLSKQAEAAGAVLSAALEAISGIVSQMLAVASQAVTGVLGLIEKMTAALMGAGVEAQRLATTFGVLTGSMDKGRALFGELQNLTIISPYSMGALTSAAETLMGMGVSAENLKNTLTTLGDAAVGDESRLKRLSLVFGEVTAEGKMTGWRIRQLASLGIGVEDLAKTMGLRGGEFRDVMAKGGVPSDILRMTLNRLTAPGGRMFGMSGENLDTTGGRWNQLTGTVQVAAAKMGEAFNKGADFAGLFEKLSLYVRGATEGLEKFALAAGQYAGEIVRQFIDLGAAAAGAVKDLIEMAGIDLGKPAEAAKALADAFVSAAKLISGAAAEIGAFVGSILQNLPDVLPKLIAGAGNALITALDSSLIKSLIGADTAKSLQRTIAGGTAGLLGGMTDNAQVLWGQRRLFGVKVGDPFPNGFGWDPAPVKWAGFNRFVGGLLGMPDANAAGWNAFDARRGGMMGGNVLLDMAQSGRGLAKFGGNLLAGGLDIAQNVFPEQANMIGGVAGLANFVWQKMSGIPQTQADWRNAVVGRYKYAQQIAGGEGSPADRLTNAASRGSTEAYETFARSWAAGMQGTDALSLFQRMVDIQEEQSRTEKDILDEARKFTLAQNQKFGLPLEAGGI